MSEWTQAFCDVCHRALYEIAYFWTRVVGLTVASRRQVAMSMMIARMHLECAIATYRVELQKAIA